MNAEIPANLSDDSQEERQLLNNEELDALVQRADEDLLRYIKATATFDAAAGLRQIMEGDVLPPETPGPAGQV